MKKIPALTMILILALCLPALAETTGYDAVYTAENPVPGIARRVRPAVVQVVSETFGWTKETGETTIRKGYGSGVYFDARGYVVTNYHVVQGADEFTLVCLDGRELPATLVGGDDGADIAVLKFEGELDAQPVPLGDSDALEIGELVVAIGNPGNNDNVLMGTVTAGIVSGLDREDMNAGNFSRKTKVIQTDAAINTGNSGGALLNAKGELIGIPTLKYMFGAVTVYEGLGFAIPVNTAKPLIEQLIEKGKVVRPRLGVMVVTIEGPDRPLRNAPPAGVQVQSVEMGGPAANAGMVNYDIILEIDGIRVKDFTELTAQIDTHQAGDSVSLKVCRYFNPATGEPLPEWSILDLTMTLEILD